MFSGRCRRAPMRACLIQGSGYRVQGARCRVQGSGFRVQSSGFRVQGPRSNKSVPDAMLRVQGSGCRVQGSGFRVQGAGCRVQGSGFRVQGAGCRVSRLKRKPLQKRKLPPLLPAAGRAAVLRRVRSPHHPEAGLHHSPPRHLPTSPRCARQVRGCAPRDFAGMNGGCLLDFAGMNGGCLLLGGARNRGIGGEKEGRRNGH